MYRIVANGYTRATLLRKEDKPMSKNQKNNQSSQTKEQKSEQTQSER